MVMVVAALMPELGIGYQGKLPWRLSKEIITFKKITSTTKDLNKRNAVVMGRRTWESIPKKFRPLPDRLNVIVTRNPPSGEQQELDGFGDNLLYLSDLNRLDSIIPENIERLFLIGGSELYNQCFKFPFVKQIILTELHSENSVNIDTYLNWDLSNWQLKLHKDLEEFVGFPLNENFQEKGFTYTYRLYQRT